MLLIFALPRRPYRLAVRTPPFHGGGTGSIPVRVANRDFTPAFTRAHAEHQRRFACSTILPVEDEPWSLDTLRSGFVRLVALDRLIVHCSLLIAHLVTLGLPTLSMEAKELLERLWDFAVQFAHTVELLPHPRVGRHVAGQWAMSEQ